MPPVNHQSKLPCQVCGSAGSKVLDSRPRGTFIRRRRECLSCRHKWSTYEVSSEYLSMTSEILVLARQVRSLSGKLEELFDDYAADTVSEEPA
jgi:hypothetical protein